MSHGERKRERKREKERGRQRERERLREINTFKYICFIYLGMPLSVLSPR